MGVSCRICGAKTEKSGHLFTCQNKACGGVHWDKGEIKLREAQIIIEEWRKHYNTKRPHSGLGYRPPAPEAIIPLDQRPIMH